MAISLHFNYQSGDLLDAVKNAGNNSEIGEVYMQECNLYVTPNWIYLLENLNHLNVAKNNLKFIDDLCILVNLDTLDASDNQIETLNERFFELRKLKSLNLSGNKIRILSDGEFKFFFVS